MKCLKDISIKVLARQVLEASEIILHPDYNWDSSANDIALVIVVNIHISSIIISITIVITITIK